MTYVINAKPAAVLLFPLAKLTVIDAGLSSFYRYRQISDSDDGKIEIANPVSLGQDLNSV